MVNFSKQPGIRGFENVHLAYPESIKLRNGIPVWVVGNGEDEIVRVEVFLGGGDYEEEKVGLSLLVSSLVLKGNENMTPEDIAEAMDYYGAKMGGMNAAHLNVVHLASLSRNFSDTLKIFYDCVSCPTFPENACDTFKRQFASYVAMNEERVEYLTYVEMRRLYYGESCPFSRMLTSDGILSVTSDDLIAFHQKYYSASNCRIIVSGRVTDTELRALDATFGQWESQGVVVTDRDEAPFQPEPEMLSMVDKKDALQSAIGITIRAIPRRHPDYFKLRIMMMAFGGYFGSRLMTNIREDKGYTYGIDGMLCGDSNDGFISITTSCDTKYTWPVIDEVKKEMRRLREELIPKEELETVKQHMLSDLMKTLDTPFKIARHVGLAFTCGIYPEYFNDQVQAIKCCGPEDLMEMAQKYLLEEKMRIVIAGDVEKIDEIKENI